MKLDAWVQNGQEQAQVQAILPWLQEEKTASFSRYIQAVADRLEEIIPKILPIKWIYLYSHLLFSM